MPISVSGTEITFNDATVQTTAAVAGGVTSLNGQTGAITNTTFNAIGSYCAGSIVSTSTVSAGSTQAGTSIVQGVPAGVLQSPYGQIDTAQTRSNLSKSGTWRAVGQSAGFLACCCTRTIAGSNLWVRIS
jgi:tryptophan synthase beta subunit